MRSQVHVGGVQGGADASAEEGVEPRPPGGAKDRRRRAGAEPQRLSSAKLDQVKRDCLLAGADDQRDKGRLLSLRMDKASAWLQQMKSARWTQRRSGSHVGCAWRSCPRCSTRYKTGGRGGSRNPDVHSRRPVGGEERGVRTVVLGSTAETAGLHGMCGRLRIDG